MQLFLAGGLSTAPHAGALWLSLDQESNRDQVQLSSSHCTQCFQGLKAESTIINSHPRRKTYCCSSTAVEEVKVSTYYIFWPLGTLLSPVCWSYFLSLSTSRFCECKFLCTLLLGTLRFVLGMKLQAATLTSPILERRAVLAGRKHHIF